MGVSQVGEARCRTQIYKPFLLPCKGWTAERKVGMCCFGRGIDSGGSDLYIIALVVRDSC